MSTILALLNQIKNEEIVLPAIQRDFVWPEDKCTKLLDSILRGYPVGIILLWETYLDIQYRTFDRDFRAGSLSSFRENPPNRKVRLVLDGQQRLQSLYVALYGSYESKRLYYDLLSGRNDEGDRSEDKFIFRFLPAAHVVDGTVRPDPSRGKSDSYYEPISELLRRGPLEKLDLVRRVVAAKGLAPADEARLRLNVDTLERALSMDETVLKVATIDENLTSDSPYRKSEADVLEIFVRINRQGTPLSRSDLVFSMLKLNWRESAEALPEFVRRVNQGNSFDLDTDFVIRSLFAVCDLGAKIDLDVLRRTANVDKLRANFDRCCAAIAAAVDFVQVHCWVASSAIIGSSNTLVPIVYFLYHAPRHEVPNDQVVPLRQMFYLLGLSQSLSRYGESRLGSFIRSDLKPTHEAQIQVPIQRVVELVQYWESVDALEGLLQANPSLTLHLVQSRSGARVQYAGNRPEIDHIFPRSVLRENDYTESQINNVANFWILARSKNRNKSNHPPMEYFADVPDDELAAALIDRALLSYDLYPDFITKRLRALVEVVDDRLRVSALLSAPPIARRSANPPWSREELILALDLYRRQGLLDDGHAEVVRLSQLLQQLAQVEGRAGVNKSYRNPNGVAMKLGNFASLDPAYPGSGLPAVGQNDRVVWEEFAVRNDLIDAAERIRADIAARRSAMAVDLENAPSS